MPSLSILIVAKNEAHNIVECVQSCSFADEIIVLDSGSTDGTAELARAAGAVVHVTDWPGYGPQKQRALALAQSDWVLSLDADERISEALKNEILCSLDNPMTHGYRIPRLSSFCGEFIHHSGWRPDFILRLARREKAQFSDHQVHEHMACSGRVEDFKQSIIHYSYRDLNEVLSKLNSYSSLAALEMSKNKPKRVTLGGAIIHGVWAFLRTYVIRAGFKDGSAGLILAIYNAEYTYYKYIKYRELQVNRS